MQCNVMDLIQKIMHNIFIVIILSAYNIYCGCNINNNQAKSAQLNCYLIRMASIKNLKPKPSKNNHIGSSNNHQIVQAYTNAAITKRDINDVIDFGIKYKQNQHQRKAQTRKNWSDIKSKSQSKVQTKDHSQMQSQTKSKSKQNNVTSFHTSNKASPQKAQLHKVGSEKKPKQSPTTPSKFHNGTKKQRDSNKRNTIDLSTIANQNTAKQKNKHSKEEQYMALKYNTIGDKHKKNNESQNPIGNSPFRDILVNNHASAKKQSDRSNNLNQHQFNRLLNLKQYLQEDIERLTKLKKMSDEHVLSELGISQNAFMKRVQSVNHQIQSIKNEANKKLECANQHYQLVLENNVREIDHLKAQLTEQRTKRVKIQCKMKQTQVIIKCIKDELAAKQKQCQNARKQAQAQKSSKKLLQESLRDCAKEKQFIKRHAQDVLSVVREQLMKTPQ